MLLEYEEFILGEVTMAIITIFGGFFCHTEEIATDVCQRLSYRIIDEYLLKETFRRFQVEPAKLAKSLYGPDPLFNVMTHERQKNLAFIKVVLSELIQQDNVMLRQCVGHLIPRTISHVLRICLIANLDYRTKVGCKETGESEKRTLRLINDDDRRNHKCTEYLFEQSAYSEKLYDMVIAVDKTPCDEAVKSICDYSKNDAVRTTDQSQKACRDFLLSARVELELVRAGFLVDVHSEDGHVILSINENIVRMENYRRKLIQETLKIDGVREVTTQRGSKYKMESINPWSNIETPPQFMLVDDEKDFVNTLSERLKTRNLESSIAYDGEQALDMVRENKPDVMVLDLMMPGIDGLEVLRRLKQDHPEVQVIILTGHGSDRERQQAEELGAFAYLQKPVNVNVLAGIMREAYGAIKKSSQEKSKDEDGD
ncbi:MAG: response regulator [Candidatus Zixiibacteriota bacterium]